MDIKNIKIRNELRKMVELDQKALNDDSTGDAFVKVNNANCKRFREIYNQYGVITISKFGAEASTNAWLLVQHFQKSEVDFKKKYLEAMKLTAGDVSKRNLAYMEDRILVETGNDQIFGTQGKQLGKTWEFFPITDIQNVDKRRELMELEPLSWYAGFLELGSKYKVKMPNGYMSEKNKGDWDFSEFLD